MARKVSHEFPDDADRVWAALASTAPMAASMDVVRADGARRLLELSAPMSLFSWGSNVAVWVEPSSSGGAVMHLTAASKFVPSLGDLGRQERLLNELVHLAAAQLRAAATTPSAGWHADPAGRHQYRYWDGAVWTDHVSDGGEVSTDAL